MSGTEGIPAVHGREDVKLTRRQARASRRWDEQQRQKILVKLGRVKLGR